MTAAIASLANLVLACLLLGCGPPAATPAPAPPAPPACTPALLSSFDPGLEVSSRQLLPPAEQRAAEQTEQVVVVACREEENDPTCARRAESEVRQAFPDTTTMTSEIVARKIAWRARLSLDGVESEQSFEDLEALVSQVQELRAAGRDVAVVELTTTAAADSPRDAVVRARGVVVTRGTESLRIELTVRLPTDEALALGRLQERAARAHLVVHGWEVKDDHTLRVELGCVRTVEPAAP